MREKFENVMWQLEETKKDLEILQDKIIQVQMQLIKINNDYLSKELKDMRESK